MTLTNYWWLLIWLVGAGLLLSIAVPKQQVCLSGQICYKWSWLSCIILVTPYLIWCSTRSQFGDSLLSSKLQKN